MFKQGNIRENIIKAQQLLLQDKIKLTKEIVKKYYNYFNGRVVVAFSGGKDSSVMLDIIRQLYPNIKAVFFNTTNESSSILKFVKSKENVDIVNPKKTFKWSLLYNGYPLVSKEFAQIHNSLFRATHIVPDKLIKTAYTYSVIKTKNGARIKLYRKWLFLLDELMISKLYSIVETNYFKEWYNYDLENAKKLYKELYEYYYDVSLNIRKDFGITGKEKIKITNRCCDLLKKQPADVYKRHHNVALFVGMMATDSKLREKSANRVGCFNNDTKTIYPLIFWTEKDIWDYINTYNINIASDYETEIRTGCTLCGFGITFDLDRFDRLSKKSPKKYNNYRKIKNIYSDLTYGESIDLTIFALKNYKKP